MREIEWNVLSELMKNSKLSDRELAKRLGSSQPTITRVRRKLENEGYIKEYTIIPDFAKIGYTILAITFVKLRKGLNHEDVEKATKIAREDLLKGSSETVMMERGKGLGYEGVVISYHHNYPSYVNLLDRLERHTFLGLFTVDSFLVNLGGKVHYRPLTFATLAKHMLRLKEKKE